jgi:hypothetical protein
MKPTEKKTDNLTIKTSVSEVKKSKIALYWEDRERRGIPPGIIHNMRAILK